MTRAAPVTAGVRPQAAPATIGLGAEFVSTAAIVLASTVILILFPHDAYSVERVADLYGWRASAWDLGLQATFLGLVTGVMAYSSAAHSPGLGNPVLVISLWCSRRIGYARALSLLAIQVAGSLFGALIARGLFVEELSLGASVTTPLADPLTLGQAALIELLVGFLIVWVLLSTNSVESIASGWAGAERAAVVYGLLVTAFALGLGALTAGIANPARVIGPMVILEAVSNPFVFVAAPIVGGITAALWTTPTRA